MYIYIYLPIGMMVSFRPGPGYLGSILCGVIPKTQKRYLMPPCLALSIIRYGSRVSRAIHGKEWRHHLGVVAIKIGAFWSTSTAVSQLIDM